MTPAWREVNEVIVYMMCKHIRTAVQYSKTASSYEEDMLTLLRSRHSTFVKFPSINLHFVIFVVLIILSFIIMISKNFDQAYTEV